MVLKVDILKIFHIRGLQEEGDFPNSFKKSLFT